MDPRQDRAGRRVDSNDLVLLVACDPERAGAVRDPIQAEAVPAVDDPVAGSHRALLLDAQVVSDEAVRGREPHRVTTWERQVRAGRRKELAEEASGSRVDLGSGLVEARHPEMPAAREDPGVVEVTAGPLSDHAVGLHVEENNAWFQ